MDAVIGCISSDGVGLVTSSDFILWKFIIIWNSCTITSERDVPIVCLSIVLPGHCCNSCENVFVWTQFQIVFVKMEMSDIQVCHYYGSQ